MDENTGQTVTTNQSPINDVPVTSEAPFIVTQNPRNSSRNVPSKIIFSVVTVLLLFSGLLVTFLLNQKSQEIRSQATNNGTLLALNPMTKSLAVGQSFEEGVTINTQDDTVSAAELHLKYDPSSIQISNFTIGSLLTTTLTPATINSGTVSVILGSKLDPMPTKHPVPFKGSGILATFKVKILTPKTSTITFDSGTVIAAENKTTNTLIGTPGSSTITGTEAGGISTPTPTAKPGSTPTPTLKPGSTLTPTPSQIIPTPTSIPESESTPTPAEQQSFNPLSWLFQVNTPTPTPTPQEFPNLNGSSEIPITTETQSNGQQNPTTVNSSQESVQSTQPDNNVFIRFIRFILGIFIPSYRN